MEISRKTMRDERNAMVTRKIGITLVLRNELVFIRMDF
jgi:hypothetical protein